MALPHHPPSPAPLDQFEQLCHDMGNALMIISGRAHLLERRIARTHALPEHERARLIADLEHIARATHAMVNLLAAYREALEQAEGVP